MQFASLTDCGKIRTNNEDCCGAKQLGPYTVLAVADGMGGANCGEIASSKAIEMIFSRLDEHYMKKLSLAEIPQMLSRLIEKVNHDLFTLASKNSDLYGMGTTLELCIIRDESLYIAHIGDSRVYKISSDGSILRLTKDHSLVEYMLDAGTITPDEAINHPQRNIITRALGTSSSVTADIFYRPLCKDDKLLLCTDGLTNMLTNEQIAKEVSAQIPPDKKALSLVNLANDAGGTDNITVIIAEN